MPPKPLPFSRRLAGALALALLAGCKPAPPQTRAPDGQPDIASPTPAAPAAKAPIAGPQTAMVALGDSLFAGYGLRPEQAYPLRLAAALQAAGHNVAMVNASVSGDTTADGLARLDFTLGSQNPPPAVVLVCLGGNDMLRGLSPAQTRANMDAILTKLEARHIKVVLMGMLAAPNLGADYARDFNAIYPALAARHHAVLVPFFMKPLVADHALQLPDHIHPTPAGVEAMVKASLPAVTRALPAPTPAAAPARP